MKNLNLSLIVLIFSSLLAGCGMSGSLYRETPPAPAKEKIQKQQSNIAEEEVTDALSTSQ
ncbi:lipoprotein [Psychromonas arctica]|uniref:Lipoprotein n=1 Tax=Psychromonas arctica TaxID=168275 RepID=A0ABU9HFS4_9GAMM